MRRFIVTIHSETRTDYSVMAEDAASATKHVLGKGPANSTKSAFIESRSTPEVIVPVAKLELCYGIEKTYEDWNKVMAHIEDDYYDTAAYTALMYGFTVNDIVTGPSDDLNKEQLKELLAAIIRLQKSEAKKYLEGKK